MTVKEAKSELMTYRVLSEKLAKLHARNVNNHLNLGMMRFRAGDTGRSKALLQRIREAEVREIELQKSEYYTAAKIEEVRKTIDRKLLMLSELDRKILYEYGKFYEISEEIYNLNRDKFIKLESKKRSDRK